MNDDSWSKVYREKSQIVRRLFLFFFFASSNYLIELKCNSI